MSIHDLINLKDKIAIVTGASRGLGSAFAVALAEAGAHVVITSRHGDELKDTAAKIKNEGREVLALESDAGKENQIATEPHAEKFEIIRRRSIGLPAAMSRITASIACAWSGVSSKPKPSAKASRSCWSTPKRWPWRAARFA